MPHIDVRNTRVQDGETVWKSVDEWYQTYWSGMDARFYAGNILLDELISLQWEMQEAVMPIIGYADYTHRRAIHGTRRVQGAIHMNFKREGYLYEILRALSSPDTGAQSGVGQEKNLPAWRLARTGTATVEDFTALVAENPTKPVSTGSGAKILKTPASAARLKSVTTAFEEAIWGQLPAGPPLPALQESLRFTQLNRPRFALEEPFDLNIQFGSVSPTELAQREFIEKTKQVSDTSVGMPVSTSLKIVAVDINGRQTVYDDSGRPIAETYAFIAKDVV
jgi:hypothetical protein